MLALATPAFPALPQRLTSDGEDPGIGGALLPVRSRILFRRAMLSGSGFGFLGSVLLGLAALAASNEDLGLFSGVSAAAGAVMLLAGLLTRTHRW